MVRSKRLTLSEQVKLVKRYGFVFRYVHLISRGKHGMRFDYKGDHDADITIKGSVTRAVLLAQVDLIRFRSCLRALHTVTQRRHMSAATRRLSFRIVHGGMSWAPHGIKCGTPIGMLRVVA